jgi:hypothetical protein
MNRREFLAMLAGLPVIGALLPAALKAKAVLLTSAVPFMAGLRPEFAVTFAAIKLRVKVKKDVSVGDLLQLADCDVAIAGNELDKEYAKHTTIGMIGQKHDDGSVTVYQSYGPLMDEIPAYHEDYASRAKFRHIPRGQA